MINKDTTLAELASVVGGALSQQGIEAVLTGGAAVVLWTNGQAQSFDLDFISPAEDKRLRTIMLGLGFQKRGKDYIHPETPYFVEFPSGPLSVGQELARPADVATVNCGGGSVQVIAPTFCVMDRLAQYFHWGDRSAFDQAIEVATQQRVDLKRIGLWTEEEGAIEKFEVFRKRLQKRKKEN